MGWLEDLTKPMFGRVWQAFFGFGHMMTVRICTDPHFYVSYGTTPLVGDIAPHLDVELRVWNRGGPVRTIISWQTNVTEPYTMTLHPAGTFVLEQSGKPVVLIWRLEPKQQPMEFKPGDTFVITLNLNNGTPQYFKAKVTE